MRFAISGPPVAILRQAEATGAAGPEFSVAKKTEKFDKEAIF